MQAIVRQATVEPDGSVRLTSVPLEPGATLKIILLVPEDTDDDLLQAAESSTDFWDNPVDDEIWNNA